jgi:hypothetical protein
MSPSGALESGLYGALERLGVLVTASVGVSLFKRVEDLSLGSRDVCPRRSGRGYIGRVAIGQGFIASQ